MNFLVEVVDYYFQKDHLGSDYYFQKYFLDSGKDCLFDFETKIKFNLIKCVTKFVDC